MQMMFEDTIKPSQCHGNEEIISTKAAIEWFSIKNIGRSPAKFDLMKLENLNSQYLRELDNGELLRLVCDNVESILGKEIDCAILNRIRCAMDHLKKQSKTLKELSTSALLFTKDRPISINEHGDIVFDIPNLKHLTTINALCRELDDWSSESINSLVKEYILEADTKLKEIAPLLRLALLGVKISPGIFDVMACLGKKDVLFLKNINNKVYKCMTMISSISF